MRIATAARLMEGGSCVVAPGRVLAAVGAPDRDDHLSRVVVRVLGLRLVLQAGLDAGRWQPVRAVDAAVELAHAASMLPVAMIWPAHRRSASVSAAVAVGIAVLDLTERGH
jgi:hypothetical protein